MDRPEVPAHRVLTAAPMAPVPAPADVLIHQVVAQEDPIAVRVRVVPADLSAREAPAILLPPLLQEVAILLPVEAIEDKAFWLNNTISNADCSTESTVKKLF